MGCLGCHIGKLLDDTSMDEVMHRLNALDKVRWRKEAVGQGRITEGEALKREIDTW